jgi:ribosomal protein L24E
MKTAQKELILICAMRKCIFECTDMEIFMQRTDWAERHVEDFVSLPLIKEFVFRSPMALDGGVEKEVADMLITHGKVAILTSQKCQQNPESRDEAKTERWAKGKAKEAVKQLCGALRMGNKGPIWSIHPRRKRVEFSNGLPKIDHGLVLVEARQVIDLNSEEEFLPLGFKGIPLTYLTLNDFLNLAYSLRTLPELSEYLTERKKLNAANLRIIGAERLLYDAYLIGNGSLSGVRSLNDAKLLVKNNARELTWLHQIKLETLRFSSLLELVADELATRSDDVPSDIVSLYDDPKARTGYLKIQEVLADMRLGDRILLGREFSKRISFMEDKPKGFTFAAFQSEALPGKVFIFASSKCEDRSDLVRRLQPLTLGAMAHYNKTQGLMIVDRDGVGFEVMLIKNSRASTQAEVEIGRRFFGHLKLRTEAVTLLG